MKLADDIIADPATRATLKIEWPVLWRIILSWLPTLLPIVFGLLARQLRGQIAAGRLGVPAALELLGITEADYPESLRQGIATASRGDDRP